MSDIRISLIMPFRNQHQHLVSLLASLKETTGDINSIELILGCDADDSETREREGAYLAENPFMKFIYVAKNDHFTKTYWNPVARTARGRFLIPINADTIFKTKDWDSLVWDAMIQSCESVGDDIWLGLIKDPIDRRGEDVKFPHFSCFPCVSRQSIDVLGYLYVEACWVWSVDHIICDMYWNLDRLVSLTHVFIDHNSYHHNPDADKTNYDRFAKIEREHPSTFSCRDLILECKKLRKFIQSGKSPCAVI